jgi:hypothetical protein
LTQCVGLQEFMYVLPWHTIEHGALQIWPSSGRTAQWVGLRWAGKMPRQNPD